MSKRKDESREEYLNRLSQYHATHHELELEYGRNYNIVHREEKIEHARDYNAVHREERRTANRAHWLLDLEGNRAARRARYRAGPEKDLANCAVQLAVKKGLLLVPVACSECGASTPPAVNGNRTIEAHHYLGYAREHWLDVQWLCQSCHKRIDKAAARLRSL